MDDMVGMCIGHADMMGLTDDQLMKMKPVNIDLQKKQARFKADLKIAQIELMEYPGCERFRSGESQCCSEEN